MSMYPRWNPEDTWKLTELWKLGYSATEITKVIKGKSREAILGKVWRLRASGFPLELRTTANHGGRPKIGAKRRNHIEDLEFVG